MTEAETLEPHALEAAAFAIGKVIAERHGHPDDNWQSDERRKEADAAIRAYLATTPDLLAEAVEALERLTSAVSNMRVPQTTADAGMQVLVTLGPALESARATLTKIKESRG